MPTKENIEALNAAGSIPLLPPKLWDFLDELQNNPEVNSAQNRSLSAIIQHTGRQQGHKVSPLAIPPKVILGIYRNFSKGMLYASNHYNDLPEKSRIPEIYAVGPVVHETLDPNLCGACMNTPQGIYVGFSPALLTRYISSRASPKSNVRSIEDPKVPGKYFNATEMMFITGLEESCHAQQILTGRYRQEYDPAALDMQTYLNAECEREAAAITLKAVQELKLGSDVKEETPPDAFLDDAGRKFTDSASRGAASPGKNNPRNRKGGRKR